MAKELQVRISSIRAHLKETRHFRQFCTKFAESLIARWLANIYKCKPLNDNGAYQLLLDTKAISTLLLALHYLGAENMDDEKARTPAIYTKTVTKKSSEAETLLKVVRTPHDPAEDFIKNYTIFFADNDIGNFTKVLELKGLKAGEQKPLLDLFRRHLPPLPSGEKPYAASPDLPPIPSSSGLSTSSSTSSSAASSTATAATTASFAAAAQAASAGAALAAKAKNAMSNINVDKTTAAFSKMFTTTSTAAAGGASGANQGAGSK